jgi:hypothetical protein
MFGKKISMPGPDRQAEETSARLPVGKVRITAHRVLASSSLASHPILVLSSNNVLLFSLLLLLTASVSFLSRQSHIPTQYIIPLTFPLRSSLMKTPHSSLLLTMYSTSLCLPSPHFVFFLTDDAFLKGQHRDTSL